MKHDINVHEEHTHSLRQKISEGSNVNVEDTVHDEQVHVHYVERKNIAEHELVHVAQHPHDIMPIHHVARLHVRR